MKNKKVMITEVIKEVIKETLEDVYEHLEYVQTHYKLYSKQSDEKLTKAMKLIADVQKEFK